LNRGGIEADSGFGTEGEGGNPFGEGALEIVEGAREIRDSVAESVGSKIN
jgi:hypothetical protein